MNTMFSGTSRSERVWISTAPRRVSSRMTSPGRTPSRRMSLGDMNAIATGSIWSSTWERRVIEPEAMAFMSPKDMRRLGVRPGEFIRLETRRGAVEIKTRSDRDVPENMVFMPFCYAEAAANLLTNPTLDPFGKIPEFKFCAVRAEKAELRNAAE